MNLLAALIVVALAGETLIRRVADWLDARRCQQRLPDALSDMEDSATRQRSADYAWAAFRSDTAASAFFLLVLFAFWFLGGFNALDLWLRDLIGNPILRGAVYILALLAARQLVMMPSDVHYSFRVEARFGFTRTTPATFVLDRVKAFLVGGLVIGPLIAVVLAVFEAGVPLAWLYAWGIVATFSVVLHFLAPAVILPLFNRFEPLPEGELRQRLERLLERAEFPARRLSVVDGSRRSTKSNAFFTGFGANRRIALFDTLVENHSAEEIEAVLAHEIGHCKLGHVRTRLVIGIVHAGVLLALFSLFIDNRLLHEAFLMEHTSVYASLVFFSLLYSPIEFGLGLVFNALFRKQEREADRFVREIGADPRALVGALKSLSVDHLSNLTPHPLSVAINDSHPPLVQRIDELDKTASP